MVIIDTTEMRQARAFEDGMSEKAALERIHDEDKRVFDWTEFLFHKEPFDQSLYDIVRRGSRSLDVFIPA